MSSRENPFSDPTAELAGVPAAYEVEQSPAAVSDQPMNDASQLAVVLASDVLQHAHRDKSVESAFRAAVIVLDEFDKTIKAFVAGALAGMAQLLPRDVESFHAHTVIARHVQCQRAPAATRLDHRFAGLKTQLAADMVHLGCLRGFERHRFPREIGAGVDQPRVEPHPVKVVPEVVVRINVPARPFERVRLTRIKPFGKETDVPARARPYGFHGFIDGFEKRHQISGQANPAIAPGIAESDFGIDHEAREGPQVADPESEPGNDAGRRDGTAASQDKTYGQGADLPPQDGQQPPFEEG